jgi:hypothetical protein
MRIQFQAFRPAAVLPGAAPPLAEMIAAREITGPQARAIAPGYLHDNAAGLHAPGRAGVR